MLNKNSKENEKRKKKKSRIFGERRKEKGKAAL